MREQPEKQAIFMIRDLETLKVMTDPLHLQIIELLSPEPQTVGQIAQQLGLSGSRLYYHFKLLESAGLIRVVETCLVNNLVEKRYWVTADNIEIDPDLVNFSTQGGQENVFEVIESAVDATRADMLRSLQARRFELERGAPPHPRSMTIKKLKKRLRDETFQQFLDEFNQLMQAFEDLPDEEGGEEEVSVYAVNCFLYPSFAFGDQNEVADAG